LKLLASPTTGATWVGFGTGPDAGYLDIGTDTARVIPGLDWGQLALVQVVVWHGEYNTWEEAFYAAQGNPSGQVGTSGPMYVRLPSSASDPDQAKLIGLHSFDTVIPEPAAMVLLFAGGLIALMVRRKG
jgi:hypothetical protein